jgi:dipeptidyl aminopeptidase/acylaminoacyl peptidase
MRIEDLTKFKLPSDPQISPDGEQISFVLNTVDKERDAYQDHIYTVKTRGGRLTRLTNKTLKNQSPRWSPDGKRILFLSAADGGGKRSMGRLRIMNARGGQVSTVCEMPNDIEKPSWSPDGKKVLFLSRVKVDEEQIGHKSDVKIVKHLWYKFTTTGWFHDTRKHLFVVDVRAGGGGGSGGGKPRQLTTGEFDVAAAAWMPDSDGVAYVANLKEDETDTSIYKDIWVVSSSKGKKGARKEQRRVTDGRWQIESVSVVPKDSTILFVGREIPDESLIVQKKSNLWAISGDEGGNPGPVNLTEGFDQWVVPFHSCIPGWAENPKFSPDGSEVYFRAYEKGCLHVFKVGLDDRKVQRVTDGSITVDSFSVGKGGAVAFTSTDFEHAPEVWTKEGDGTTQRQLTNFNARLATGSNLSRTEEFWFQASDGKSIQGWMIKPHGFVEGRKYPALLSIHGGPYWAYGAGLTEVEHEFQVLAAAGFAVFYTNPRGSLGYGEEFTTDISPNWAERDYADIDESVDHVLKAFPFVDASRLGVFGGSYGGYMTNWAISHTNRYRAAVTDRCVSNMYSFAGVFDLAGWQWMPKHDVGRGKDAWDDPAQYLEKSPIHHIKNISTPLLIIHSDADHSTTLDNAEQLFVGLKRLKKEAKLVIFPGETHYLSWTGRPTHRVERLRHYVDWFEDHLQPDKHQ